MQHIVSSSGEHRLGLDQYSTWLVLFSFVLQLISALVPVILEADISEIVGGVVSAGRAGTPGDVTVIPLLVADTAAKASVTVIVWVPIVDSLNSLPGKMCTPASSPTN